MKHIEYIEFPSGWRPPTHSGIDIKCIKWLRDSMSEKGNKYAVYLGEISDEDATYLLIKDINAKIRNIPSK